MPTRARLRTVLFTSALAAAIALSATQAQGAVLASNGFTADANGYSFQNYGDKDAEGGPIADLNSVDMRKLFGKHVCAGKDKTGACVLTPEAEAWMHATNASMAGGHCFGFATTVQLWFQNQGKPPTPEPFGSTTVPGLELPGNVPLQRHIAYAFTLQTLESVGRATSNTTPNGVFKLLKGALDPGEARYLLTIFDDDGGHAITPTAVENVGGGQRRIAVYDNNWPGQTRYVHIDAKEDTWRYQLAPNTTWSGTASTKSIQVVDPRPGLGHQPCFICPASGDSRTPGKSVELRVLADPKSGRHGSVVVTDGDGRSSGCGPKGCFNRIPGADLRRVASGAPPWKSAAPPVIELPTRNSYRVDLGSTAKKGNVAEGVSVLGRGFSVGASDVRIGKGENDVIKIRRDVRSVAYKNDARGSESPTIVLTSSNSTGPEIRFELVPDGINHGAGISARFDPRGRVRFVNHGGARVEKAMLTMTTYTKKGRHGESGELKLRRGEGTTIKF